jgi:excisionase family DNA binding protein
MAKILTAKQAAEMLNLNVFTVYKFSREKMIPSIRYGKRIIRFNADELEKWLQKNSIKER